MSYDFFLDKVGRVCVDKLSDSYCREHIKDILNLINCIPYINSSFNQILSQEEDYYKNKWNYSYIIKNDNDKIIGVLIAYFRVADEKHIFDSLYIHRLAISPEYRNMGIGTKVLEYFIQTSFSQIPWLLNISVQTNDNYENRHVLRFYKKVGFKEMYKVKYYNKTDILLLLERRHHKPKNSEYINIKHINLSHPRLKATLNNFNFKDVLPVVYFSSTNERKKEIVRFIFNNYNIDVEFTKSPIELTEPQVEKPDPNEERKLVSIPLKSASRFINHVPFVIEDTMLFVEFFNRNGERWELPGLDTKRWLRQLGLDGFLDIIGNSNKRKAMFVSQTGAYVKSNKYFFGRGEIYGSIAYEKRTVEKPQYGTYPYFFHLLFIPDGSDKTLAEMDMYEYAQYDYMRKSIKQLISELASEGTFERQYSLFDYIQGD